MKTIKQFLLSVLIVLSAIQTTNVFANEESVTAPIMAESQKTTSAIDKLSEGTNFSAPTSSEQKEKAQEEKKASAPSLMPDFGNDAVWKNSPSPYNTPGLWGQCTWFAWSRFVEIYGYEPGFRGNGYECVDQLLAAHPDKFKKSDTPVAGSLFSSYNHVGFILAVDGDTWTIQDANLDQVSNPVWEEAIQDWRTVTMSKDEFFANMGTAWFANPSAPVTFSK